MKRLLAGFLTVLLLCACGQKPPSASQLSFAYNSPTPEHYEGAETLCLSEPADLVVLDTQLQMKGESVTIRVLGAPGSGVVWESTYTADADFPIELRSLEPGVEYSLSVTGEGVTLVDLSLRSDAKLVPDVPAPAQPGRDERSRPAT